MTRQASSHLLTGMCLTVDRYPSMPPGNRRPAVKNLAVIVGSLLSVVACSSPTQPGATVAASRPLGPATGTQISYYSQPITLAVTNCVATSGSPPVTTVEVATDAAFATIVATQAPTSNAAAQLTVTLDHLAPSTTYYWRARTTAGNGPGAVSAAASFSIGPLLVIQPPVVVQPLADTFPNKRPTFVVANARHTGPPATLTYRFEVATESTFSSVATSASVSEGATQTSFTPTTDLTPGTTYHWRARASDEHLGVSSSYSAPQSFATIFPGDGNYRYNLSLEVPGQCEWNNGLASQWPGGNRFMFDDNLSVAGSTLSYRLPTDLPRCCDGPLPGLELRLQRSGLTVNGLIGGSAQHPDRPSWQHLIITLGSPTGWPVVGTNTIEATGTTLNDGVFQGSFVGPIGLWDTLNTVVWCSPRQIRWTLAPFAKP